MPTNETQEPIVELHILGAKREFHVSPLHYSYPITTEQWITPIGDFPSWLEVTSWSWDDTSNALSIDARFVWWRALLTLGLYRQAVKSLTEIVHSYYWRRKRVRYAQRKQKTTAI